MIEQNTNDIAKELKSLGKAMDRLPSEIEKKVTASNARQVAAGSASRNAFNMAIGEPTTPSIEEALDKALNE